MKDEALSNDGVKIAAFPISVGLHSKADQIEPAVTKATSLTENLRTCITAIHDWLGHEFGLDKSGRALAEPYKLDADGFVAAVRGSLPKSRKWYAAGEILALERKLSDLVNAAYGLTPEEVALMWRTAPPRMPLDPAQELRR